ncbi:SUF system NifU family Fe-S cluster assembly protein [Nesterenkonia sp. MY13]|uniref:SUF system NifU family Fe-S cluster assembly protein n=1 Tax=Nesterenkonia sedimenti TaxID=1463632 RepID=A0A7X8TI55_9MICC|nr:SUF system NifU family Fe-S cluster assembly protein [Nesterenkonia sedimenti]NLS08807.1 SUF system NifU family Fe-S cluster assembly protein [Nesterenkonia sedimenti]
MEQLYQQVILDHSRERSGEGTLENPAGQSFQVNPTCGDECNVQVNTAEGKISELAWTGKGCSISQASLSLMYEMVDGEPVTEVEELGETFRELIHNRGQELDPEKMDQLEDLGAFTGVGRYSARVKCALLGWMALRDALIQAQDGSKEGSGE